MKHRTKNLTLAKTLSVHKLNCALRGNFSTDRLMLQTRKVQNWATMSFIMDAQIASQHWQFLILTGKQQNVTFQKFGTVARNLQRNNKNKTSAFGES